MQKGFNKNPITNSQKPLNTSTMRKSSISLFSHLTRLRLKSSAPPLLSRNYISDHPSSSPFPPPVLPARFSPCAITHESVSQNSLFQANPSRNMNTLVESSPQISSRQRKSMEKSDLEEAIQSAKTTEEMLAAFKAMELAFEERELGMAALKVGLKLDQDQEGEDPEKALSFATRALKALDRDDSGKPSLVVAMALQLMSSVNSGLKRFSDSLGYLNRANRALGRLEEEDFDVRDLRPVLHTVQLELANVKTAMGRREEALGNLRKCCRLRN